MRRKIETVAKPRKKKCKLCPNKAASRGLCSSCRGESKRMIAAGEITEDEAIKNGWLDPPKRIGRPVQNAFARAVQSRRK